MTNQDLKNTQIEIDRLINQTNKLDKNAKYYYAFGIAYTLFIISILEAFT